MQERDTPTEITLPADTMQRIMATPGMVVEVEEARAAGGTAGLIAYLDAHGLRWREGGSDPAAAIADATSFGGFEFVDEESTAPARVDRSQARRKATRRAAKKARRGNRRG